MQRLNVKATMNINLLFLLINVLLVQVEDIIEIEIMRIFLFFRNASKRLSLRLLLNNSKYDTKKNRDSEYNFIILSYIDIGF